MERAAAAAAAALRAKLSQFMLWQHLQRCGMPRREDLGNNQRLEAFFRYLQDRPGFGPAFYTRLRKQQWHVMHLIFQEINIPGTEIHRARVDLGWLDSWGPFFSGDWVR